MHGSDSKGLGAAQGLDDLQQEVQCEVNMTTHESAGQQQNTSGTVLYVKMVTWVLWDKVAWG